ncbi:MAG: hypothetical protein AABY06_02505 [Nanoarchaeota archaeon]
MRNLKILGITLITAIVFIIGIAYYKIFDAVVNVTAFIISLTIIFLILILGIIFSQQDHKKKILSFEKSKIEIIKKDNPEKKLKVIKKK